MEAARQRSDKPGGLGNRTDALNVHTEVHSIGNKMQTADTTEIELPGESLIGP